MNRLLPRQQVAVLTAVGAVVLGVITGLLWQRESTEPWHMGLLLSNIALLVLAGAMLALRMSRFAIVLAFLASALLGLLCLAMIFMLGDAWKQSIAPLLGLCLALYLCNKCSWAMVEADSGEDYQ